MAQYPKRTYSAKQMVVKKNLTKLKRKHTKQNDSRQENQQKR
jgi:hypothetical protein